MSNSDQNTQQNEFQKNGVVVLLDALGTKGIWKDNDPIKVLKTRKTLMTQFKENIISPEEKDANKFTVHTFSDTIIITGAGDNIEDLLLEVAGLSGALIGAGMIMDIFLRGGIAVGKFYISDEMIIGPAVDEVAQYHNLPEWIGVSATPTAHRIVNMMKRSNKYKKFDEFFYECDIPLKNNIEHNGWAVAWPTIRDPTIQKISEKIRDDGVVYHNLQEIIDKQIARITDIDIALKWRNTLNFYNAVRTNTKSLYI